MISIAHLGPKGTFSDFAAATYAKFCGDRTTTYKNTDGHINSTNDDHKIEFRPYSTIAQAIKATEQGETDICIVPVENSIGGGVMVTLDTLWELDKLQIQQALTLPVQHALISCAPQLSDIRIVRSHPQALSQCRHWLAKHLANAQLIPANSTTEALPALKENAQMGAIASKWGAQAYDLPVMAYPINDYADNYTRFWVLGKQPAVAGSYTSLAFSLPTNEPGALLKPLQLFSALNINMSRIESRPTKRLLGEYVFFIDIEANASDPTTKTALELLKMHTETLRYLGSYNLRTIQETI